MQATSSSEEEYVPKKRKHISFWDEYTEEEEEYDKRRETTGTRNVNKFVDFPQPVNFVKSSTEEEEEENEEQSANHLHNLRNSTFLDKEESQELMNEDSEAMDRDELVWSEAGFVRRKERSLSSASLPKDFGVVRKVKSDYLFASSNNRKRNQPINENSVISQGTNNQLGSWEKYTKGFGSKMLQKMGFTGRLGAYEQGLSKPLEPQVRPKNLGLAAEGFQEKLNVNNNILSNKKSVSKVGDNETQRQSTTPSTKKRWKKRKDSLVTKVSSHTPDIIIDMRGSEECILHNMTESVERQTYDTKSETFLPELQYNIRILKDLTKNSLEQSSEQIKVEQRRLLSLQSEWKALEARQIGLKESRSRLESFLKLIKEMDASSCLHDLVCIVRQAMERFSESMESNGILNVLTACAQRHLNTYFGNECYYWKPTIPDTEWIQDISDLGNIFGGRDESKIYSQLLYNTIIVRIKRHVASSNFNPQQPHDLVYFIERYYKVFPEAIIENLAADIVYPRLLQEVEGNGWQVSENLMPHQWIFPWLPLLGKRRVAHLFDYIWRRIGKSMKNWHPSKSFAREVIEPWLQVAKKSSLSKLFHQYVIPRLEETLKDELIIEIPPEKESLSSEAFSVFYWIIGWYGIIENEALAGILLKGFFPVWLETLLRWLRLQDVDWEQVTMWYDLWKQKFPLEIQRMNNIRRAFDIALDVMNRSMIGQDTQSMDIHRLLLSTQVSQKEERIQLPSRQVYDTSSFKDLVGYFAERNGVTLIPCHNQYGLQEPSYLFGNIPIRLDHQQQVVYYQSSNKTEWKPISLEDLLQMTRVVEQQKNGASHRVAE